MRALSALLNRSFRRARAASVDSPSFSGAITRFQIATSPTGIGAVCIAYSPSVQTRFYHFLIALKATLHATGIEGNTARRPTITEDSQPP
jgi:hypothetical protein